MTSVAISADGPHHPEVRLAHQHALLATIPPDGGEHERRQREVDDLRMRKNQNAPRLATSTPNVNRPTSATYCFRLRCLFKPFLSAMILSQYAGAGHLSSHRHLAHRAAEASRSRCPVEMFPPRRQREQ